MPIYQYEPLGSQIAGALGAGLSGYEQAQQQKYERKRQEELDKLYAQQVASQIAIAQGKTAPVQITEPTGHYQNIPGGPPPKAVDTMPKAGKSMAVAGAVAGALAGEPKTLGKVKVTARRPQEYVAPTFQERRQALMDAYSKAGTLQQQHELETRLSELAREEQNAQMDAYRWAQLAERQAHDTAVQNHWRAQEQEAVARTSAMLQLGIERGQYSVETANIHANAAIDDANTAASAHLRGIGMQQAGATHRTQMQQSGAMQRLHAKPQTQKAMEAVPAGVTLDYTQTKVANGIVYVKGSDGKGYAWRHATKAEAGP